MSPDRLAFDTAAELFRTRAGAERPVSLPPTFFLTWLNGLLLLKRHAHYGRGLGFFMEAQRRGHHRGTKTETTTAPERNDAARRHVAALIRA
jgi:hypothetical protein